MNNELPNTEHPLFVSRQLPSLEPETTTFSENGILLADIQKNLTYWIALQLEDKAGIGADLTAIDTTNNDTLAKLDVFIQRITMNTSVAVFTKQDIVRLNSEINNDDMVVATFIYSMLQYLDSHWGVRDTLSPLCVNILSCTSFWGSEGVTDTELGRMTRCPGWVTPTEAEDYVRNVYWMVPIVLMSGLRYANIRRQLIQLNLTTPYPSLPKRRGNQ